MFMRWLNSQTFSYLLLMPEVWQVIWWVSAAPAAARLWRTPCVPHSGTSQHCTSCPRLAAPQIFFQGPVRLEPARTLSGSTAAFSAGLPKSHCWLWAAKCSAAMDTSELPLSLARSRKQHSCLRKHSQLNWTPLINYAAKVEGNTTLAFTKWEKSISYNKTFWQMLLSLKP